MIHLLISREYPPCAYPMGGIGTYGRHMARLLAEAGETVHVIAERWRGAPRVRDVSAAGHLIVHRVQVGWPLRIPSDGRDHRAETRELAALASDPTPARAFGWQAARLAEHLIAHEGIEIIEAQDYEAPLWSLLARRASGAGPARRPPAFVHLHTSTRQVFEANGWSLLPADARLASLEEESIVRADALLAPSRFMAETVERQRGMAPGTIATIPYPIGAAPVVDRSTDVWQSGTIVYLGRLEPRKGVFEWMDAALTLARERPDLRFEFIGGTTPADGRSGPTVRSLLAAKIPASLQGAFRFRGPVAPTAVSACLATARLVVVPSRFENFPHTCVEAMASGVPVLATRNGGMAEMIEDGRTGWLTASARPVDLIEGLRRVLATSPARLAEMGRAASESIRVSCDNETTVRRHLQFRERLIASCARTAVARSPGVPRPALSTETAPWLAILRYGMASVAASVARRVRRRGDRRLTEDT